MNVINIDEIRAMSTEEKAALNRQTMKRLVLHVAGMMFIKATLPRLTQTLARGAIITAARKL